MLEQQQNAATGALVLLGSSPPINPPSVVGESEIRGPIGDSCGEPQSGLGSGNEHSQVGRFWGHCFLHWSIWVPPGKGPPGTPAPAQAPFPGTLKIPIYLPLNSTHPFLFYPLNRDRHCPCGRRHQLSFLSGLVSIRELTSHPFFSCKTGTFPPANRAALRGRSLVSAMATAAMYVCLVDRGVKLAFCFSPTLDIGLTRICFI